MVAGWRPWLKRSALALAVLLLLITVFAGWLLGSRSGAIWALGQVSDRVDGLAVGEVRGSLWSGLSLSDIVFDSDAATVKVQSLEVRVRLTELFSQTAMLDSLKASGIDVVTAQTLDQSKSEGVFEGIELPAIELPMRLIIRQFDLRDLTLSQQVDSRRASSIDSASTASVMFEQIAGSVYASADDYQALSIDDLLIRHAQGEMRVSGHANLVTWDMDLNHHSVFSSSDYSLITDGNVSGDPTDLRLSTTATISGPSLELSSSISAQVNLDQAIADVSLILDQSRFRDETIGWVNVNSLQITADGNAQLLDWTVHGSGQVERAAQAVSVAAVDGAASGATALPQMLPFSLDAQGSLVIQESMLRMDRLRLETPIGLLEGALSASLGRMLHLEMDARLNRLDTGLLIELSGGSAELSELNADTSGRVDGSIKGQVNWLIDSDLAWFERLTVVLDEMSFFGEINGLPVDLDAVVTLDQASLEIQRLSLSYADNSLQVSGRGDADNLELTTRLNALNLSQLSPELSGSLLASIDSSGSLAKPLSRFDISGTNLVIDSLRLKDIESTGILHIDLDQQTLLDSEVALAISDLQIDQVRFEQLKVDVQGASDRHQLTANLLLPDGQLTLSLEGAYQQAVWNGWIRTLTLAGGDAVGQWDLRAPAELSVSVSTVTMKETCLTSRGHLGNLCVTMLPTDDTNLSSSDSGPETTVPESGWLAHALTYQADGFTLSSLKGLLPPGLQLDGLIDGEGQVTLDHSGLLSVSTQMSTREASLSYSQLDEEPLQSLLETQLDLIYTDGQLDASVSLRLGEYGGLNGRLTSNASNGLDSVLAGSFDLVFDDAQYLAALSDDISQITGQLIGQLEVSGQLKAPVLKLDLGLDDGQINLARTGTSLTELNVQAGFDEQGDITVLLTTRSGDGQIRVEGQGRFEQMDQWQLNATIQGEGVELIRQPEIQLSASPDMILTANPEQLSLTGRIGIPSASIQFKQLPESAVSLSSDVVVHRPETGPDTGGAMQLNYDLQVDLEAPVAFNAVGLSAQIIGDLRLRSRPDGTMWSTGALTLVDGVYKIYGQQLILSEGRLMFNGPISNPSLDVKATREARNSSDLAGIQLGGTVNSLSSSLYSVPAMPDMDVLSILLTGRRGGSGEELSSDDLARAVILLGLKDSTNLLSQFRDALGIDVFNVRGAKEQSDTALEAGKYINEDLYVGYALGIFNRTGVLLLRYQINKRLSLESEYGERQSFDLIYSIEKKR